MKLYIDYGDIMVKLKKYSYGHWHIISNGQIVKLGLIKEPYDPSYL